MPDNYLTIAKAAQGVFRDRGSRFLSFAFPVETAEEVKEILQELRRKYHDARHHCYAWRTGVEDETRRTNDDGEPTGTAGRPIMAQIEKHNLTNMLIVVVRYFGGTLLGTGGLINAYREAAADALANCRIISKTINAIVTIDFPYSATSPVMRVLNEEQAEQVEQQFTVRCKISARVPRNRVDKLLQRLDRIEGVIAEAAGDPDRELSK